MKLFHLSGTQLYQLLCLEPFFQMIPFTLPATPFSQNKTAHFADEGTGTLRWIALSHTGKRLREGDLKSRLPASKDRVHYPDEPSQKQ